jgi:UDP-glucose:(heptosyl)LPS alpha-1,3-glucosyltransferase
VFQPHIGSCLRCWEGSVASCAAWFRPVKRLCGFAPRYRRIRRMTTAQFNGGSGIFIALSHKVAHDMQRLHNVPAERIRVVYNGIDFDHFALTAHPSQRLAVREYYGVGRDEVLVVAVAHHFRLKGIPLLIKTVRRLRGEGVPVKLLLCGGKNSADPNGDHQGPIFYCGNVEDTAPFYTAADICVHPTFYDACSLVTLEALASGLPVVTTHANGASELITPGVNGFVLDDQRDLRTLAGVLRMLVSDTELRCALGLAGRRLAMAHSAERNYHEIVATYRDVLSQRSTVDMTFEPLLEEHSQSMPMPSRRSINHHFSMNIHESV